MYVLCGGEHGLCSILPDNVSEPHFVLLAEHDSAGKVRIDGRRSFGVRQHVADLAVEVGVLRKLEEDDVLHTA